MDPITQGVVGATFAQIRAKTRPHSQTPPHQLLRFALIGALSGMAADLDMFIRSAEDPLLALEYHRHFTHSLIFIPIGALLCSLLLYPLIARRWQMGFRQIYIPALIGYATHGLLDAATSYGTQLFWPFSNYRVGFDLISVVDPLFSAPILLLILAAMLRHSKRWVYLALLWGVVYLSLGFVQQQRAETIGWQVAADRGHEPLQLEAKPSFGNIIVWKVVYEYEQAFYVDAVRPGLFNQKVWHGESIAKLNVGADFFKREWSWLDPDSQQAEDIERFRWFSGGYIAVYPKGSNRIADMRYSMLPHEIEPLWGIELSTDAGPDQHVDYITTRGNGRAAFGELWNMIKGSQ